jgi:hypothetical protein
LPRGQFWFWELDSPTALTVTAEIVGKSVAFPNGDGSGKVKFNSTAQNYFYKYILVMVFPKFTKWDFRKEFCNTWNYNLHRYCNCIRSGGVSTTTTIDVYLVVSKMNKLFNFFNRWFQQKMVLVTK